jgi:acyl-CoA synthetase (AMP-forming)/AMP-acid ligase II
VLLLYPPGLEYIAAFFGCLYAGVEPLFGQVPSLKALRWHTSDDLPASLDGQWREPAVHADTLAFLQYTSGSTAAPKGVMVTHGNLLSNERMIRSAFQQTEHSVIVGWLPLYHDMGLIGNVIQPCYAGAPAILMSPVNGPPDGWKPSHSSRAPRAAARISPMSYALTRLLPNSGTRLT